VTLCFICDSLSPGQSGVGDYTAVLATALERHGHRVSVVSLMEHDSTPAALPFAHLRLEATQSWQARGVPLQTWLNKMKPDIISLQFVPYAYDRRGLPFGFASWLKRLSAGQHFHIMFHELWVAAERNASLKNRISGIMQRSLITSLLRILQPVATHTSNRVYEELLRRLGWPAQILPLFSNITPAALPLAPWRRFRSIGLPIDAGNRSGWLIAVVFGTLHPGWDVEESCYLLLQASKQCGKQAALLLVGRSGQIARELQNRLGKTFPELIIGTTGELTPEELSGVFQTADLGISASPWALAGKASAFCTLKAHGVPVVFTDDRWRLRRGVTPLPETQKGVYLLKDCSPEAIAAGLEHPDPPPSAQEVAARLHADLCHALLQ